MKHTVRKYRVIIVPEQAAAVVGVALDQRAVAPVAVAVVAEGTLVVPVAAVRVAASGAVQV